MIRHRKWFLSKKEC